MRWDVTDAWQQSNTQTLTEDRATQPMEAVGWVLQFYDEERFGQTCAQEGLATSTHQLLQHPIPCWCSSMSTVPFMKWIVVFSKIFQMSYVERFTEMFFKRYQCLSDSVFLIKLVNISSHFALKDPRQKKKPSESGYDKSFF